MSARAATSHLVRCQAALLTAAVSLSVSLLGACEDPTLEGRLVATLETDQPDARVDLFAAEDLEVSLVEPGRVLVPAVRTPVQLLPALRVSRGAGELRLDFKDGIPDGVELVLVAWVDADHDGKLDLDPSRSPAARSEVARAPQRDADLLIGLHSEPDHWRGTVRSVFRTGDLAEGRLEGWRLALDAAREGPPLADRDDDGIDDDTEVALGTDPGRADTDGDGSPDGAEIGDPEHPEDDDDDGVLDALEPAGVDEDGDGADAEEDRDETDPCVPSADACDSDEDGLSDEDEGWLGTTPWDPDSDGDGELDGDERDDSDGDGKSDALERDDTDEDGDGTVDELDPSDGDPCVPVEIPGCAGDPPPPP